MIIEENVIKDVPDIIEKNNKKGENYKPEKVNNEDIIVGG